jgi:hypothetical protein
VRVGALQVFLSINARQGGFVEQGDPDAEPVLERPQLFQALGEFEGGRGEGCPAEQRAPGTGVDTDVLVIAAIAGSIGIAMERIAEREK